MSVVITGCSSGIGHAVAIEFAKKGYKVIAGARRLDPMRDLETYGIKIVKLDVTSKEDIEKLKQLIESEYNGEVKYLFNNAGQPCTFPAIDVKDEEILQCYDVNVFGCIRMARALMPYILKTKGTIGFTGSVSGMHPFPFSAIYSSTKAAINSYADTLGFELEPFGVKVINVVTGGVRTNIADDRPLNADSWYQTEGIEEALDKRREMAKRRNPMEPDVYARKVINDLETSQIGKINVYRGSKATILYWAQFLPRFLVTYFFRKSFGLTKLFNVIRTRYQKTKVD